MCKRRREPGRRGMARRACVIHAGCNVIRICRFREIRLMALIAVSVRNIIVAVDVAVSTRSRRMSSSQRKFGGTVIEGGRQPYCGCVAR